MATMAPERVVPIPLAGEWKETSDRLEVRSPYDGSVVAVVAKASAADIDAAIGAAQRAFETTRQMPAHQRSKILAAVSGGLTAEREDFARTLSSETGKPIRDARTEVDRAIMTFAIASEEAKRVETEVVPMDWAAHGENRFAINSRFPIGVVLAITPFNFPLNLTAHKIAPAIAVGNTVVVKPASQTPLSGLKLAKLVIDSGWPAEALSVVPSDPQTFEGFVVDARVRKITFTGSPVVGWHLKQIGWRKKVTLELGGNAGVISARGRGHRLRARPHRHRRLRLLGPVVHQRAAALHPPADLRSRARGAGAARVAPRRGRSVQRHHRCRADDQRRRRRARGGVGRRSGCRRVRRS